MTHAELPSPKVPAVFLDRDGVLNFDTGYPHIPADLVMIPGAAQAVKWLNDKGYRAIIVTNQSGVGRGLFTLEQMNLFNDHLVEVLARDGAIIDAVYATPFAPDAVIPEYRHPDHPDRKPNPGMILRAIAEHDIDPERSFMIGDRTTDVEAAHRAGIRGFQFQGPDLDAFVRDLPGI